MSTRVRRAGKLSNLPAKVDAGLRKGLHISGMRVAARARRVFELFRPRGTATSATVNSITVGRVQVVGNTYSIPVGPGTAYAKYLHEKTPPQRYPPLKNIIEWLKVKPGTQGRTAEELTPIAKLVQAKIALVGTDAFPFMTSALNVEKDEIVDIVLNAVVKEITK